MPICIECRYPVKQLYTTYSKADDRSLGKGVRLTQCPQCKQFADKYVEHDFVIIFIDLVLIKPQVYRHLLFNRLADYRGASSRTVFRLGILLLLFDVYLTWARVERSFGETQTIGNEPRSWQNGLITISSASQPESQGNLSPSIVAISPFAALPSFPLVFQYLFFLGLCALSQLSFHLPIRFLYLHPPAILVRLGILPEPVPFFRLEDEIECMGAHSADPSPSSGSLVLGEDCPAPHSGPNIVEPSQPQSETIPDPTIPTTPPSSSALSFTSTTPITTAILVSSGTKLFPLFLLIWNYDFSSAATALNCTVTVNNIAALKILLDGEDCIPSSPYCDYTNSNSKACEKPHPSSDNHAHRPRRKNAKSLISAIIFIAIGAFVRALVIATVLTGIGIFLGRTHGEGLTSGGVGGVSNLTPEIPSILLPRERIFEQPFASFIFQAGGLSQMSQSKDQVGTSTDDIETLPLPSMDCSHPTKQADEEIPVISINPTADMTSNTDYHLPGDAIKLGANEELPLNSGIGRSFALFDPWAIWQLSWRCGLGFMLT